MTIANWPLRELGAVFVIAGVLLMIWALFWDRSRGRRRCPKCWYDLRGSEGLTCSECGYTVIVQRTFYRTRRRWRYVLVATLLVVMGCAGWAEQMRRGGRWSLVPNIVLIEFLPKSSFDDKDGFCSGRELARRVGAQRLRPWECRRLIRRSFDVLESGSYAGYRYPGILTMLREMDNVAANREGRQPWGSWVRLVDVDPRRGILTLISLLEPRYTGDPLSVASLLKRYDEHATFAVPALLGLLVHEDYAVREAANGVLFNLTSTSTPHNHFPGGYRYEWNPDHEVLHHSRNPKVREFFGTLGEHKADQDECRALLETGLNSDSPDVRMVSVWALALLHGQDPEIQNRILDLWQDEEWIVRKAVLLATSAFPLTDRVEEVVNRAFDERDELRFSALSIIGVRGPTDAVFADQVHGILAEDNREQWLTVAAKNWVKIGGDPHVALDLLIRASDHFADGKSLSTSNFMLRAIAELGVESEAAVEVLEPLLEINDPRHRCYIATASAVCGGDGEHATRLMIELWRESHVGGGQSYFFDGAALLARADRLSIPMVCAMLESSDYREQLQALRWLERSAAHVEEALPTLRELKSSLSPYSTEAAEILIKRIEWERQRKQAD